jgi:hypothetical protein
VAAVLALAVDGEEAPYAEDVGSLEQSQRRFVQIKALPAPGLTPQKLVYIALLNYQFTGVEHPNLSNTTWKIARINRDRASWKWQVFFDPDGLNDSILSARFADLAGDGPHYALVETEFVSHVVEKIQVLSVFDMNNPKFATISRYQTAQDINLGAVAKYEAKLDLSKRERLTVKASFFVWCYTRERISSCSLLKSANKPSRSNLRQPIHRERRSAWCRNHDRLEPFKLAWVSPKCRATERLLKASA